MTAFGQVKHIVLRIARSRDAEWCVLIHTRICPTHSIPERPDVNDAVRCGYLVALLFQRRRDARTRGRECHTLARRLRRNLECCDDPHRIHFRRFFNMRRISAVLIARVRSINFARSSSSGNVTRSNSLTSRRSAMT